MVSEIHQIGPSAFFGEYRRFSLEAICTDPGRSLDRGSLAPNRMLRGLFLQLLQNILDNAFDLAGAHWGGLLAAADRLVGKTFLA